MTRNWSSELSELLSGLDQLFTELRKLVIDFQKQQESLDAKERMRVRNMEQD